MSRLDRVEDWAKLAKMSRFRAGSLAKLCQVSFSQLRRFTLLRFQASPQLWLDRLRLEEAARLIRMSKAPLKEIAFELEFADQSHFSHLFRKHFGCKPSEFALKEQRDTRNGHTRRSKAQV